MLRGEGGGGVIKSFENSNATLPGIGRWSKDSLKGLEDSSESQLKMIRRPHTSPPPPCALTLIRLPKLPHSVHNHILNCLGNCKVELCIYPDVLSIYIYDSLFRSRTTFKSFFFLSHFTKCVHGSSCEFKTASG